MALNWLFPYPRIPPESLRVNPNCTALSLIPTVDGNTVRSFSTHGQQSAAKGSSTTVSRSDIRLIQHLDSSALGLVRRWRLIGYFLILYYPFTRLTTTSAHMFITSGTSTLMSQHQLHHVDESTPTALSLITSRFVGNTVRNVPTHGQLSAAQGSPTNLSLSF